MENNQKRRKRFTKLRNIFRECRSYIPDRGAFEVKSKLIKCKEQEQILEMMRQKNELLEEIVDIYKHLNQDARDETRENEKGNESNLTKEALMELIDKGMELYSSIETPKEIKVLFPFEKDTAILPDNITKLLEEKEEDD